MAYLYGTARLNAAVSARGATLEGAQPLAGDGSDRQFFRLLGSPTVVLLHHPQPPGEAVNENDSYFHIGRHLKAQGAPVPEIYDYCREEGWMLLEDLGDISLEIVVRRQPGPAQVRFWYRQALEVLVRQQINGAQGFDTAWCFDTPQVHRPFLWERECKYFLRAFLRGYLGLEVRLKDLAPDFARMLTGALPPGPSFFLHRDFQSRNLFIANGRLRVIDFQGGRLGPLGYDVAALVNDPYVNLGQEWEEELLALYLDLLKGYMAVDDAAFREQYAHLALCRNLQVLGAYGFLTRVKGKEQFARHIPAALAGLKRRLQARAGEFPLLEQVAASIISNQ